MPRIVVIEASSLEDALSQIGASLSGMIPMNGLDEEQSKMFRCDTTVTTYFDRESGMEIRGIVETEYFNVPDGVDGTKRVEEVFAHKYPDVDDFVAALTDVAISHLPEGVQLPRIRARKAVQPSCGSNHTH